MQFINSVFPPHVTTLLKRLGIVLLLLYITRIIFLIFNYNELQQIEFSDYFAAIWFDLITIGLFYLPFYSLYLLPLPFRGNYFYRLFFKVLFFLTTTLLLALNLLDVEYFKYTSKRSTYDLFSIVGAGDDVKQLLTTFVIDFWFLILMLIILVVLGGWLYRKTEKQERNDEKFSIKSNTLGFLIFVPILFIMGRGGFALKPTGIIEATKYAKPESLAFVLNTPFTMVKTIDQPGIELKNYFNDEECLALFNPIKTSNPQHILPDSTNVVILMLESFGVEFVGSFHDGNGYTPFLDSIIAKSLSFEYAFANGKKSIEAVPAVFASLPSLMDNPYISSKYGDNKIKGLASILREKGYETAFYHGATNGSMRFDGFSAICGFDHYFGRFEYNNDAHFDETWGILDEYFNPWTAEQITQLNEPFCAALFTLSSHHPYFIPDHMQDIVKRGPQEICASISYGDIALRKFFDKAKEQPWFDNTLFVLLADHTPSSSTREYNLRPHMYRIPILFYHPGGKIKPEKSEEIFQQLDIMPSILDLLNIETNYYAYGNSMFEDIDREAITYISGTHHYFKNGRMTNFYQDEARNLYCFKVLSKEPMDSISYYKKESRENEQRLKAIIQRYNFDLIMNQTTADEKKNTLHN